MSYEGIRSVADRAALISGLRQTLMTDRIREANATDHFEVDNTAQRLSFVGPNGERLDAHAELIASVAPGPRSLLWGWAHPQGFGDDRFAIRQLGERFSIADLTTGEIPMPASVPEEHLDDEVLELSHLAGLVGVEAIRDGWYYTAPTGHGPRMVYWLRGLDGVKEPTMLHVASRLPEIAAGSYSTDYRSGLLGIAEHLGWYLDWQDAEGQVGVLRDPYGQSAEVAFDNLGRIANLKANISRAD